jgi:competence protein ComEC
MFHALRRYALAVCAAIYVGTLIVLHALGLFPRAGPHDLSRLIGQPVVTLRGSVVGSPLTRWGQTRFLLEGRAIPLSVYRGRVAVNLNVAAPDLMPGERVQVRGWLYAPRLADARHSFDERAYWAGFKTYALMRVWSAESFQHEASCRRLTLEQTAWRFHQNFKRFWFDRLPFDEAALLCGITMGSRGVLPSGIKNQCIRAGVYHILVVSGQKVALIIALGVACLRLLRVPRRWAFWICTGPILFYAYAVGADPPVVRASTMAVIGLAVFAMGRDVPRGYPLILAGLWMLLREPEALFGASFQLSFCATASLVWILPWFEEGRHFRNPVTRWFLEAGAVCLAVHLGTWPLLVYYFHQLSLVGVIANWTLFPLSGVVMVCGLAIGTWGVWGPGEVPSALIATMHWMLKSTLHWIEHLSAWRWAALPLSAPSTAFCVLYYGVLIAIFLKGQVKNRLILKRSADAEITADL